MGVAKGGPGASQSNPTKIVKDKTCTHYTHALRLRLIELNNIHNIVYRTPQSKILATPMRLRADVSAWGT